MAGTSEAIRAAKLSRIPGVTIDQACKRFGVAKAAVQRARREVARLSMSELALAALTSNGTASTGHLVLAPIAGWIDYLNHDGCTAADVSRLLAPWIASGVLAIDRAGGDVTDDDRWRLTVPWP